ncbi:hypothetical protein JQK19_04800 [Chromobacterium violaceum]|uniref:hypothetical protein n=1 Tax=Chromobacterium violaceum TaxID=536 RepID=UPI001BE8EADC|nr:hypothetical protein [Chromobacterium violaceum]MBT2866554.1 hypothetical protein [Chromobacterium violaceum]
MEWILLITAAMALAVWRLHVKEQNRQRQRQEAVAQQQARADALMCYFRQVDDARAFPDVPLPLNMQAGEFGVIEAGATLYGYRKQSYNVGGAVRVARGVYVGGGQRISVDALTPLADGALNLTNKRAVFLSPQKTISFKLSDVMSLEAIDNSTMVLHTAKRTAPLIFSMVDCDAGLIVLLIKLFSSGTFDSRFLPDGLRIEPKKVLEEVVVSVSHA